MLLYWMFPYFETRTFRWKIVRGAPFFWAQTVFDTKNLVKQRRFPLRNVSLLWDITFPRYSSPLFYPWNVSTPECVWNIEAYPTKFFGTVRQWTRRKIVILPSPFIQKILPYQIVSETQNRSPAKFSGAVKQNNFDRTYWSSPPPLSTAKFSDSGNLLNFWSVPLQNVLVLCGEKNSDAESWLASTKCRSWSDGGGGGTMH